MPRSSPSSWRSFFTECIQQQFLEVLSKNTFIPSKLPTAVGWSQEEREEGVKSTCFMSKSESNRLHYSSSVEELNLFVESESLPAEVNDLNIELYMYLLVEVKEKLAMVLFCGF